MCFFGGDGGAGEIAQQQRADELARQARIKSGMAQINSIFDGPNGFGDEYYNKRAQAYRDYATPQLDRSYKLAKDQMIYALDRSGILRSSAAINKNQELSDEFDKNRLDIENKAQSTAAQARQDVETARANIVNQLNATGDDTAAASAALRQATNLNQPQGMSPLGQLFSDFTANLAAIGSNSRNDYGGFMRSSPTLYSSGGSSRVVH